MSFEIPGKLEKFKIIPTIQRSKQIIPLPGAIVMVNPTELKEDYKWIYKKDQATGTTSTDMKFSKQLPKKIEIPLLFDGTGMMSPTVLPLEVNPEVEKYISVSAQIGLFIAVAGRYNGEEHTPNAVILSWGMMAIQCYLEDLNLKHTLFKPNGTSLRCVGTATFTETKNLIAELADLVISSPDLSHYRIVEAGNTLPLLCEEIYGDASRHLEVARHNNLQSIRSLRPGMRLSFPPIDK